MKNKYKVIGEDVYIDLEKSNMKAIIDLKNLDKMDKVTKWSLNIIKGKPYVRGYFKEIKKYIYIHRFLTDYTSDNVVDHIDGNPLNNKESNLRLVTQSINMFNRQGPQINNSIGYRNVRYDKNTGKYNVDITYKKKRYQKCSFETAEDANEYAIKFREELKNKYETFL